MGMPLQNRAVDCLDSAAPYDDSCWGTLNLTVWLSTWKATTPSCTSADDGSHCCSLSTASDGTWTACFLRLALANADYDCSVFNGDSCALAGFTLASDLDLDTTRVAQYRYVV